MNDRALDTVKQGQDAALAVRQEQNMVQNEVASEVPMIAGLDEAYRYRLPRLGKIHLGVKAKAQSGAEYPRATDYFVLSDELKNDAEFRQVLADMGEDPDKPRKLPVVFPCHSLMGNLRSSCDLYGSSRGLLCRTFDGVTCGRVNTSTGEIVQEPCKLKNCAKFQKGDCHWIHRLRIMLPDASGMGVWQVDTTSPNNRANLLTEMKQIKEMLGGVLGGVDLILTLEPQDFQVPMEDKKTKKIEVRKSTAYLLHVRSTLSLRKLQVAAKDARAYDSSDVQDFDMTADDLADAEYVEEASVQVDDDGRFDAGEEAPPPIEQEYAQDVLQGEIVENATTDTQAVTPAQIQRIYILAAKKWGKTKEAVELYKIWLKNDAGCESSTELTVEQASEVIEKLTVLVNEQAA